MIDITKLENLVAEISTSKIEKLAAYVQKNEPASISKIVLKNDLQFTSSESHKIKYIIKDIKDGEILSVSLRLMLKILTSKKSKSNKLVISGNFYKSNADFTHETIYQMINRAKSNIVIVGYVMYDIQDLLGELNKLQEEKNLKIKFIMDSAKKWRRQILQKWNKNNKPEIFEANIDQIKALHAKIIIIDHAEILITSANLTINAMEKNIEAGIWTSDQDIINSCYSVFKEFEENGSIRRQVKNRR